MFEQREAERPILEYCQANNLAYLPYGVLGGSKRRGKYGDEAVQAVSVRTAGGFPALNRLAADKGVSPESMVLAWMLGRWSCLVHIIGAGSAVSSPSSTKACLPACLPGPPTQYLESTIQSTVPSIAATYIYLENNLVIP